MIKIPKGKKVIFKENGDTITTADLILEEDVTFTLNSSFESLVGGGATKFLTVIGGLLKDFTGYGFSGQFKELGFQIWTRTDPIGVSFQVSLYMKTNAFTDVVVPAKALMKLPLPYDTSQDAGGDGQGFGLIAPGPTLTAVFTQGQDASIGKKISVDIGTVRLPLVVVKKVEPTVSKETDQNGHPIWIKLRIDVDSLFTATANMIDNQFWV
jgi:hypothetical protein